MTLLILLVYVCLLTVTRRGCLAEEREGHQRQRDRAHDRNAVESPDQQGGACKGKAMDGGYCAAMMWFVSWGQETAFLRPPNVTCDASSYFATQTLWTVLVCTVICCLVRYIILRVSKYIGTYRSASKAATDQSALSGTCPNMTMHNPHQYSDLDPGASR